MERTLNDSFDLPKARESTKQNSFYKKLVLSSLNGMKLGSLRIVEPDGQQIILGNPNSDYPNFTGGLIKVNRSDFYKRCVLYGDIGFAESYMDGDWETEDIVSVLSWLLLNIDNNPSVSGSKSKTKKLNLLSFINRIFHRLRENTIVGSKKNIVAHYDLGNDFYKLFLDETMTYSSGIFVSEESSLKESQIAKYDSLCKMLHLKEGLHILEIGSGWGGFSIYAAKNYRCKVTTVTISNEQFAYAKKRIQQEGLSEQIDIQLKDYRNINGSYDRIASIEMLEAVGDKYYETYFAKCNEVLKKDGLLGIQVITCPDSRYNSIKNGVDFIQKYIFPGSLLPSIARLNQAINNTGDLFLHQMIDFGLDYSKTLKMWRENFESQLKEVKALGYSEKFIKMWRYYLSYCEAAFKMRNISVIQAVYTRPNNWKL